MILINKRLAMEKWAAGEVNPPDVTRIKIKTGDDNVVIYNVYCDCKHSDNIQDLKWHLRWEEAS